MAGIDKTYVTKEQLIQAIEWAKNIKEITLENGYKFSPIEFIEAYNEINSDDFLFDEKEYYVLWNTPMWFDRWLWNNCNLTFVRERLQEQYDEKYLKKFEEWTFEKMTQRKQKYTFLKIPKWNGYKWFINNARRKNPWPNKSKQATYKIDIVSPNCKYNLCYDKQTDTWNELFGMLPCYDEFIWQEHHKYIPTKKTIIRQLKKWNLPIGSIVTIKSIRYKSLDFKILVK